ncbi:CwfJ C-terminus 1-domain-containing protein-like protein [Syncephalis fuscata]|nr:CwfJ C-terminus 1-domain-containing protein-like protein [Syncephalis fuscata]
MATTDNNAPVKISLMVGPTVGGTGTDSAQQAKFNIKTLLGRVASLNKKSGPFDIAIIVGDIFTDTEDEAQNTIIDTLLSGKIDVPITTYWVPGRRLLPQTIKDHVDKTNGELCPNLTYLGVCGMLTTAQGIKLAYVGGADTNITTTTLTYNPTEVESLLSKAGEPDLLLTFEWPQNVVHGSSETIANVVTTLRPRYHFAVSERSYYEREPYRSGSTDGHVTRFIGLAPFGNKEKMQWAYAMSLVPTVKMSTEQLAEQPANTTDLPFINAGIKRAYNTEDDSAGHQVRWGDNTQDGSTKRGRHSKEPPAGYVCRICNQPGHFIKECPQKTERSALQATKNTGPCWFCLGSPDVAKHLIASIGETFYMALPKGSLVDGTTSNIPGGGHILLIPIQHCDSLQKDKYLKSLTQLYAEYNAVPVVFELNRPGSQQHAHFQVVPVPKDKIDAVSEAIESITSKKQGLQLVDELPVNNILAHALGTPERGDWRQCVVSDQQEAQDTQAFKQAFKPFDFTL